MFDFRLLQQYRNLADLFEWPDEVGFERNAEAGPVRSDVVLISNVASRIDVSGSVPSFQILEVFRRKLEGGRKHIILQVIDGSSAWDWQHNR